jgi:hypothetical protein
LSTVALEVSLPSRHRIALRGLAWVTWRQHRLALVATVVLLGGVGAWMVATGLGMHHAFFSYGLTTCGTINGQACQARLTSFMRQYANLVAIPTPLLAMVPGFLGVFVGAPVVARELDSGTYRFAWTQGQNQVRWLVAKLVILGSILSVLALAFSAVFTWWYGPWSIIQGRISAGGAYEVSGVVFAARTLFAFLLGALLGTIMRRTVPAMAATAAVWLGVALTSIVWLRRLIQHPIATQIRVANSPSIPGQVSLNPFGLNPSAWVVAQWTQDAAGHHISQAQVGALLNQAFAQNPGATRASPPYPSYPLWLAQHGYSQWISYEPNVRFWHFQSVEAAAYVLLAGLCAAATVWWIRRRAA